MLLGSGASQCAGVPGIAGITQQVLSGENVIKQGSDFRLVNPADFREPFTAQVKNVVGFVNDLEWECNRYFDAIKDKDRKANYEDVAYVAQQIEDALTSEYENPALYPLIERLSGQAQRTHDDLRELAADAVHYTKDTVTQLLSRPLGSLDYLLPILDAFRDERVAPLDLFTLNHDLVMETALRAADVTFSDGFDRPYGSLSIWNDHYPAPSRKLFKLHGSLDWFRYQLKDARGREEVVARTPPGGDPVHAVGPSGELLEVPDGPSILMGTFNKILSYPTGIYADQHFRFHEALRAVDRLIVIGYGFRDKAINARLVAWIEERRPRTLVVMHRDPEVLLETQARGAVRNKWRRWQEAGLLHFVYSHLDGSVAWPDLYAQLG